MRKTKLHRELEGMAIGKLSIKEVITIETQVIIIKQSRIISEIKHIIIGQTPNNQTRKFKKIKVKKMRHKVNVPNQYLPIHIKKLKMDAI